MNTEQKDKFANLPHLSGKCQIMWHGGFYDGPLSGTIWYEGEMCYFRNFEEYEPTPEDMERWEKSIEEDDDEDDFDFHRWYRKHAIYRLSDDDKIRLVTLHALFQSHVGLHTDYWPVNGRRLHPRRDESQTVPSLHYGPSGDAKTGFDECSFLRKHWVMKHGDFQISDKEPFGFIYHSQLYGREVTADGEEVQTEKSK